MLGRLPFHAYIYTGTADHSACQISSFTARLRAAGASIAFSEFPGGHNWRVWREHAPLMLEYASKAFGK